METIVKQPINMPLALALAQGEFGQIVKNREVQIKSDKANYKFRYADLEEMISKTRPALAKYGLAVIQCVGMDEQGQAYIETMILHETGDMRSRLPIPKFTSLEDPKKFGAAIAYLRRYMYGAMLCLAADDDLDEDGHGMDDSPSYGRLGNEPEPPPRVQRKAKPDGEQDEAKAIGAGEMSWVKKKLDALGLDIEALAEYGVESIESMTAKQFQAVKTGLMKR